MEYQLLGKTGVKVSELCFGTMSFAGDADKETSRAMFNACREAGINFFDCADYYQHGDAEEILGELIKPCRDELVITTKAYFPMGDHPNAGGATRFHLVRAVEASLRRLGTDRIDVFFVHRFDENTALEETLRALDDLVRGGKLLYLGVSNFAAWQIMKALGISAREGLAPLACIQPMYNLVKRQAEVEILPMAQSEELGVMTYSPLGAGLLTGKYARRGDEAQGRLAVNKRYQTRYGDEAAHETAERFTALAGELGYNPVSLAVRWASTHPAVTCPIIGARNVKQLQPSLRSVEIPMDEELRSRISSLAPEPPPATDRTEERVGL